jgi:hypothetical protein
MNDIEKNSSEAIKSHELLIKISHTINKDCFALAVVLKNIRDKKLFLSLDYNTFESYCELSEANISYSQAKKFILVYERWIDTYGHQIEEIADIPMEKLYIASSQANSDNQEEWLEKARTLPRDELRAETPGSPQKYHMVTCPYCGKEFPIKHVSKVD